MDTLNIKRNHNPITEITQSIENTDNSSVVGINKPPYTNNGPKIAIDMKHNKRQKQTKFIDLVMFEYLQRALAHNILIDNIMFQKKANEVRKCIGVPNFSPSFVWLKSFMRKFDLADLSLESLICKNQFIEKNQRSLDVDDLVNYVRQHQKDLHKAHLERKRLLAFAMRAIHFPSGRRPYKKRRVNVKKDYQDLCEAPNQQYASSSLSDIAENPYVVCCPEGQVEMFTINFLEEQNTVKSEADSIAVSVAKEKETSHGQMLLDNFENKIKREKNDSAQLNEDIKPDLDFISCGEFLKENIIKTNDLSTAASSELVIENKEWQSSYYTQPPLPDIEAPRKAL